jgi:hypothetical protein
MACNGTIFLCILFREIRLATISKTARERRKQNCTQPPTVTQSHTELCEVLTALSTKSVVVWDVTPCSPAEIYQTFGETCCPQLQGRRGCSETSLTIYHTTWRQSQKTEIFIRKLVSSRERKSKSTRKKERMGAIFCKVMPCSLVEIYRQSGGTYWLHFQGRRIGQASNKQCLLPICFLPQHALRH